MFENYNKEETEIRNREIMETFPTNPEIYKWLKEQKYQTERGEQEYTMLYEIDMPRILKDFTEYLLSNR